MVLQMLASCYSYRKFLSLPCVPGHVGSILNVCIYYLAAGLRKISSSVYKGRQTPWPAQELHILFGRNLGPCDVSQGASPAASPRGSARGRGDAGCVRGFPAALAASSLGVRLAREGLRPWLCSELPADISLLALGSRLSALPLNPQSWKRLYVGSSPF